VRLADFLRVRWCPRRHCPFLVLAALTHYRMRVRDRILHRFLIAVIGVVSSVFRPARGGRTFGALRRVFIRQQDFCLRRKVGWVGLLPGATVHYTLMGVQYLIPIACLVSGFGAARSLMANALVALLYGSFQTQFLALFTCPRSFWPIYF